jgi:hypothetical protein
MVKFTEASIAFGLQRGAKVLACTDSRDENGTTTYRQSGTDSSSIRVLY